MIVRALRPKLLPAVALALAMGCAGASSPPPRSARAGDPERATPPIAWDPGSDRIAVRAVGVEVRLDVPITRFAPDEVGSAACGDRLVHAMVVDRRTFAPSDALLTRALWRAGCEVPEDATVLSVVDERDGARVRVSFDEGPLAGEWALRSVVLERAHRTVVVVSAARAARDVEPAPVFEIVSDAPGLEDLTSPTPASRPEDTRARQAMELLFGTLRAVGEVARMFR